ncbi:MAG TPA: DUF2127 domain-containing protein [Polyangia bacterium]|nr:DUF2127 domain-containing protein [Polyangia bacterium]
MPTKAQARPTGVGLIVTYKVTKALLQIIAAAILFYGAHHGLSADLAGFAEHLREHAVHAWSNLVAAALLRFTHERHGLIFTASALLGDAILSSIEAWALTRRFWWGEWLVVVTTSGLIPFEIHALFRHVRVGRVILLVLNLLIVTYLVRNVRRRRAAHRSIA